MNNSNRQDHSLEADIVLINKVLRTIFPEIPTLDVRLYQYEFISDRVYRIIFPYGYVTYVDLRTEEYPPTDHPLHMSYFDDEGLMPDLIFLDTTSIIYNPYNEETGGYDRRVIPFLV